MEANELFEVESVTAMRNIRRNTRGEVCQIRFRPLEEQQRPDMLLEVLIQHLLDRVLHGRPPPLLVGLQLHPPAFERPFVVPLRPPEQNNARALAAAVERLNDQSEAEIDFLAGTTETKVLAVWSLDPPQRQGACDLGTDHQVTHSVRSLVRVHNPADRLCLARAVLIGLRDWRNRAPGGGGPAAFGAYIRQQHLHGPEARNLLRRAGVSRRKHMYGLDDVASLQRWLNTHYGRAQIRLVVFEKEREYRIVFKGEGPSAQFNLSLLLENRHFNYVGKIEQLFRAHGYCVDCERSVTRRYHPTECKVACRQCLRWGPGFPCQVDQARQCDQCHFVFPNADCFNTHLAHHAPQQPFVDGRARRPFRSICQWRRVCGTCGRVAYAGSHRCPPPRQPPNIVAICTRCEGPHTAQQPCFIQPIQGPAPPPPPMSPVSTTHSNQQDSDDDDDDNNGVHPIRLCFFDAETSQDTPLQLNAHVQAKKHVPLLLVVEVICEPCIRAGISVHNGHGRRAPNCVCGTARGPRMRQLASPPFRNAPGDNTPPPPSAPIFNPRRFYFHSFDDAVADPVEQFLDFLLNSGPRRATTVCISHNGGKYDMHLVLEALHRRNLPPRRICTTGLKIYSMRLSGNNQRRVVFKDSLNYFFCELDGLPKAFDLPPALATSKPFFPYLFIQRQHLQQRLNGLPPIDAYQPDHMKPAKREAFLQWYAQESTTARFQLREQLITYCTNDVAILRESVIRFRQLIGEHTQGLDPFSVASTGAGLALATLRRCFLPPNRLVHSPEGGYLRGRRASAESQRYIRLFELQHPGAQVQCASWAMGEAHVEDSGYRVDGLWHRPDNPRPLAIEYMGCFYHGCPDCFPNRQQILAAGRTAEDLHVRTTRRLWELENVYGCDLHVMWGCELQRRLRGDPALQRLYHQAFVPRPLDPREDALRGGRTEPFMLHYTCADDEEIVCIDIVSLYPYVMKVNPFPVGNPQVLTRETLLQPPTAPLPWTSPDANTFRGILLVRVLAPPNMRLPLLGFRTRDGRFTFPLCAKCAEQRQQRPCRHTDMDRSWVAAYTHVELNKALQLGYRVIDLFEVWHYTDWDDGLFRSYVNTFVGLKQQASGWPPGCDTAEQRQAYVEEFERIEGIRLDPARVAHNPGLRWIAKILANSLWGKFAQRVGHTEIRYTRTPAEFHRLLEDSTLDKLDFVHVSPHMDRCVVRKRPEFAQEPVTNCLPVAIFVTSYARLHLYGYMEQVEQLGHKILYCDTDSIYYVATPGRPHVPEGEALGQMKRERADRHIFEFVAGGPKNYGIKHRSRENQDDVRADLKVRSFRLTYATNQLLNFESMKNIILEHFNIDGHIDDVLDEDEVFVRGAGNDSYIRVPFPQIGRNALADLYTRQTHKDYQPHYQKGRIQPGMQTLPFGYR